MHFTVSCRNIGTYSGEVKGPVHVSLGTTDTLSGKIPMFYNLLSGREKARADNFKFKSDFECYVSVHALLRMELSKLLKIDPLSVAISETVKGKPFVHGIDLPISLSRSENLFAFVIGVGGESLGVDIEKIKSEIDLKAFSEDYFSDEEKMAISLSNKTDDRNRTFYGIWTRKEAFLKAVGTGITVELRDVNVPEGNNSIDIDVSDVLKDTYTVSTFYNNTAVISIASSIDFVPCVNSLSL